MSDNFQKEVAAAAHRRNPCHLCGGDDFTWGQVWEQGQLRFIKTDSAGWFGRNFPGFGGTTIEVRQCKQCGNLQLFAPP